MKNNALRTRLAAVAGLAILSLGCTPALAAEYWLRADAISVLMPGSVSVPMWAFGKCTDATYTTCDPATVPGPALVVPPGEGLIVNVKNNLPENISIVIPGQVTTMTPVWNDGSSGARPSLTARVRSFTSETPAGGTATYTWPTMKSGTYLYQSGTHPQVQVQMGLYGAVTQDSAAGQAYPGVSSANQITLLYSEIDPALHNAVAGPTPTYGTAAGPTSTFDYQPKYFLVNGKPYSVGDPSIGTVNVGGTTLLRFLNAGLVTHVPVVDGAYLSIIAEDGNPAPWAGNPRQRYSVFLPAAKTIDATLTPLPGGAARIAIFDRALALTNNTASQGGMLSFLDVTDVGGTPTITSTPILTGTRGTAYSYQVTATDPEGAALTYSLTTAPAGMAINAASGLISWLPGAGQVGANAVTVRATDPTLRFATQSFTIAVVADPTAHNPVITSAAVTTATYGLAYVYQVTATDVDGGTLTYSLPTAPAGMTINSATGNITWTPTKAQVGNRNVTVRVTDPTTLVANQPYTITVADANYAAVANPDSYSMIQGGSLAVTTAATGVIANDTDPDGDTLTMLVVTPPADGTLTTFPNGRFTYTPPATVTGTRTFTYLAQDHVGGAATAVLHNSNTTTVTIAIAANRAPTTVADTFTAPKRTGAAYTAVVLPVLANDSDPDTAADATNTIDPATIQFPNAGAPNKGGTVTANANGTVSYTPAQGFKGTENFTYRVRDTRGALSTAAQVKVNVQ